MKIALLTHSVNPRGGVVHTLELARALHDAGHHVTVFAPALPGQRLFRAVSHPVDLVPVGFAVRFFCVANQSFGVGSFLCYRNLKRNQ